MVIKNGFTQGTCDTQGSSFRCSSKSHVDLHQLEMTSQKPSLMPNQWPSPGPEAASFVPASPLIRNQPAEVPLQVTELKVSTCSMWSKLCHVFDVVGPAASRTRSTEEQRWPENTTKNACVTISHDVSVMVLNATSCDVVKTPIGDPIRTKALEISCLCLLWFVAPVPGRASRHITASCGSERSRPATGTFAGADGRQRAEGRGRSRAAAAREHLILRLIRVRPDQNSVHPRVEWLQPAHVSRRLLCF